MTDKNNVINLRILRDTSSDNNKTSNIHAIYWKLLFLEK